MIKNVIFDWSGVVKDCAEGQWLLVNKVLEKFGALPISFEEFRNNWEQPYMAFYNKYLPKLTLKEEKAAYKEEIIVSPPAAPYPGIVSLIKEWQRRGIRMAVVSSDFPETLQPEIERFGLQDIFVAVYTDAHDKHAAIRDLVAECGFAKSETAVVGDSGDEIAAGRHIGISTVAVTWGLMSLERLAPLCPDFIFQSVEEFAALCPEPASVKI